MEQSSKARFKERGEGVGCLEALKAPHLFCNVVSMLSRRAPLVRGFVWETLSFWPMSSRGHGDANDVFDRK